MSIIEKIDEYVIYENPLPQLRSRHGAFPGITQLLSGEIIALFVIGEAFESVDSNVFVSRSKDSGKTWQLQGPLYDRSKLDLGFAVSDSLKSTLLSDGTLVAIGYRFHRRNPDLPVGNAEGGLLSGDDIVSFSTDDGKTWTIPKVIQHGYPELLETSGPCIELHSGDLMATSCPCFMWDGTNPTGQVGILLRSSDRGLTWDTSKHYFTTRVKNISSWESRLCEMQDGRIVVIFWAYDHIAKKHLPNYVSVSHDDGDTWSDPINTGHMGQASNLMWLGGDKLLTVHAHRVGDIGLYVRLIDFAEDKWKMVEENVIWDGGKISGNKGKTIIEQWASIKFGQPSLLGLDNGEILATHWCFEDCQGKILTHRLRINL